MADSVTLQVATTPHGDEEGTDTRSLPSINATARLDNYHIRTESGSSSLAYRLVDNAPVALLNIYSDGTIIVANKSCKSIIGIPSSVLLGTCLYGYLDTESIHKLKNELSEMQDNDRFRETYVKFGYAAVGRNLFSVHIAFHRDSSIDQAEYTLSFSDALRQQQIAGQLRSAKNYLEEMVSKDALTGLPNRLHFVDALRTAMFNARTNNRRIVLMYFDLDGFKLINDQLGHRTGDQLLCEIANRLKLRIRDVSRLARLGGDEFTLILDYNDSEMSLLNEAKKVLTAISGITHIDSHKISISASIGISIYPGYAKTPEELIQYADAAMYRAKNEGRNRAVIFCEKHYEKMKRASELAHDMRNSIEQNEFYLNFQPIIDSQTGLVDTFEVLTRWRNQKYGLISADEFITIAEKSNQIIQLGHWIIKSALEKLCLLRSAGFNTRFAINISALQLSDQRFLEMLIAEMERYELPPGSLELEITETGVINNLDNVIVLAEEIRKYGCTISVDDFGTGYSSLARITKLPVNRIKLDKYFVSEVCEAKEARVIIEAIVKIASELGLGVVAEGVETNAQALILRQLGCEYLQGFAISEPCSDDRLNQLLEQNTNLLKSRIAS